MSHVVREIDLQVCNAGVPGCLHTCMHRRARRQIRRQRPRVREEGVGILRRLQHAVFSAAAVAGTASIREEMPFSRDT